MRHMIQFEWVNEYIKGYIMSRKESESREFGGGSIAVDVFFSDSFSWILYAHAVGRENGCPRVETNIKKIMNDNDRQIELQALMEERSLSCEEAAAIIYTEEHIKQNIWWGWILDRAKSLNPILHKFLLSLYDSTPEKDLADHNYDDESVDQAYLDGKRSGLASDTGYFIAKDMVNIVQSGDAELIQKMFNVIDDAILTCDDVQEFYKKFKETTRDLL